MNADKTIEIYLLNVYLPAISLVISAFNAVGSAAKPPPAADNAHMRVSLKLREKNADESMIA